MTQLLKDELPTDELPTMDARTRKPALAVVDSNPAATGAKTHRQRSRLAPLAAGGSALAAGVAVMLATRIPGALEGAAVLAWATGWLYLAWAVDARTGRALATDLALAGLTLAGSVWLAAVPVWTVFVLHAGAGWLRRRAGGRDADRLLDIWTGVHLGVAAALLVGPVW